MSLTRRVVAAAVTALFLVSRAAGQTETPAGGASACGDVPPQFQQVVELLNQLQQLGIALAAAAAGVMLVYAGVLWMRGTPPHRERAREIVVNVLLGLALVFLAGGIVEFFTDTLCAAGG